MSIENNIRKFAAQRDHQTTDAALTSAIGQRDTLRKFVESIVKDLEAINKDDLTRFERSLLSRSVNILYASNLNK